jgi:hypothetical protein
MKEMPMPRCGSLLAVLSASLLFAASVNAQGDRWVGVGRDKDAVYYVDKQTLERTGSTVKVWTLQNYSTRQQIPVTKLGYRSVKEFFKFDCEKRTLEVLSRGCNRLTNLAGGLEY